jgi:hypothetical protein
MNARTLALCGALLLCLLPVPARSEGWTAALAPRQTLPPVVISVDKARQRVTLLQNSHETRTMRSLGEMPCTTGRKSGDKESEGDLKTPEGVYFALGEVREGLDHDRFGDAAYPLNYPNPVDRLQGNTGSGIFIHGRNRGVGPRQTLGCIVLENDDLARLGTHITPQITPVVVGENVAWKNRGTQGPPADVGIAAWGWAATQERRETLFFDIYNPVLYAQSMGQPFGRFRADVLADFARREWVDIRVTDLRILEGPGYLVTAFTQQTFPEGTSGQRRLYWMRQAEIWKIVGEEWVPKSPARRTDYPSLVDREIRARLDECARAWDRRDLKTLTRAYDRQATREEHKGQAAIGQALARELEKAVNPFRGQTTVRITARGVEARLTAPGQPPRTLLFRPANFDAWVIVRDAAAGQS